MPQDSIDPRPATEHTDPAAFERAPGTTATFPRDAACLSAYRAIRLLHILERRTGDGKGIAMADIIEELEHPGDEALLSVKSSKKAVFSAIAALRAAGYAIEYRRPTGYHLATRRLPDEEVVRLLAMIDRNRTLPAEIKRSMRLHLVAMASADIIEHLEPEDEEKGARKAAPQRRIPRPLIGTRELLELAQGQAMPVVFDILPIGGAPDARRERCSLQPIDIREQDGQAYLLGTVVAGSGAEDALRTVNLDRMCNIECRLLDGSKLMAALDDTEDAEKIA